MLIRSLGSRILSQNVAKRLNLTSRSNFDWSFNLLARKNEGNANELPKEMQEAKEFYFSQHTPNPVHRLVRPGTEKYIGTWLLVCAGGVFWMIVLGGYTRLSGSGLSMTKWKFIQLAPPITQCQWEKEFDHYQQYPEYQVANKGMSLSEFKKIYYVEFFHRLYGNCLAGLFGLPLMYFLYKGHLKAPMQLRLLGLLGFGTLQGLIGWWMVKSGMNEQHEYHTHPRVSVYRLLIHLSMGTVLYGGLLWNSLTLLRKPQENLLTPALFKGNKKMRIFSILLLHFLTFNFVTGACVAGISSGKVLNDWPFYNGEIIPQKLLEKNKYPVWRNLFEGQAMTQFNHRNAAYLTFAFACQTWWLSRKLKCLNPTKFAAHLMLFFVSYQVLNGILTLLAMAPVKDSVIHQTTALTTLTTALYLAHTCRNPSALYATYLARFV